jgi:hypothetical protein
MMAISQIKLPISLLHVPCGRKYKMTALAKQGNPIMNV